MNKPNYKLLDGCANTVGELIELLNQVPSNYTVTLSGMNAFGILMDTENEGILLDDVQFIIALYENETEEEIV